VTESQKAYAAGLFDGEGSILIDKPRPTKGHTLWVPIAMREPEAVAWLQERWPGSLRPATRRPKGREAVFCWYWRRCTSAAATFLSDILPYLLVKESQAQLAIEFQSHKSFTHGRRLTNDVLAFDEGYRTRVFALRNDLHRRLSYRQTRRLSQGSCKLPAPSGAYDERLRC
jgi:hypothetical protein